MAPESFSEVKFNLAALLKQPPPSACNVQTIDFDRYGFPEYSDSYAILVRHLLSRDECAALLAAARASASDKWEQAMINVGEGQQELVLDTRNCDRIMWDDRDVADLLLHRILPHLSSEIISLDNKPSVTGYWSSKHKDVWRLSRLNERLRFLKYTAGMYFRPHCDGNYVTPDGAEVSFLTVHIYLNSDGIDLAEEVPLQGGATRFYSMDMTGGLDIPPRAGDCLIFQHEDLVHSGEDVIQGVKYTMRTDIMFRKIVSDQFVGRCPSSESE